MPATNHGALIPNAVSNSFSVIKNNPKNYNEGPEHTHSDFNRGFIVCCIPFFVPDLALGDEVETDADFVLQRVVHRGGQYTFRIWFGEQSMATRESVVQELQAMRPLMEWSSENLLALSAGDDNAQEIADILQAREEEGLLKYETGRAI